MKKLRELTGSHWWGFAVSLFMAVILFLVLSNLNAVSNVFRGIADFLYPIIVGGIVAYVLDPLTMLIEKRIFKWIKSDSIRRGLSVLVTYIIVLSFVTLVVLLLADKLKENISGLLYLISGYVADPYTLLDDIEYELNLFGVDIEALYDVVANNLSRAGAVLQEHSASVMASSINTGKKLAAGAMGIILSVYFLNSRDRLRSGTIRLWKTLISDEHWESFRDIGTRANRIMVKYITYDVIDSLIIGVANAAVMLILRMPNVTLISLIVGVTNLAPTFGPVLGAVNGAIILFLVDPKYALWFLIITVILQTIDGYVLKPRMFGSLLGISSVWIMISIVIGGRIFGIMGILLAIPFAAITDFLYQEYILPVLEARKERIRREKEESEDADGKQ